MKVSMKPELSSKWWSSEKPAGVKGAELSKALEAFERALADDRRNSDASSVEACMSALESVEKAVQRTISKECDSKEHKDTIAVLKKFDDLTKAESKRLEAAQARHAEAEDDDDNENKLFDRDYVCKMLQLMRSTGKELNFSLGLNPRNPSESQLLLCRKRKPDKLWRMLKRTGEFQNRQLTYGKAQADPVDGKVLVLRLEDNDEPPQIHKIGREFLRSDKSLRFRKLRLVLPGGATREDLEPDVEDEPPSMANGNARTIQDDLSDELAKATKLAKAWEDTLAKVADQIGKLCTVLKGQSDPALQDLSQGLGTVMNQFPDLELNRLIEAAKANDRAAYDRTVKQTAKEIREVHNLLTRGPLLSTIDENPFVKTNVHSWVNAVLKRITDVLDVDA